MELLIIVSLMHAKKFTSFCQVLKRCAQKTIGSFFLPYGVRVCNEYVMSVHCNVFVLTHNHLDPVQFAV